MLNGAIRQGSRARALKALGVVCLDCWAIGLIGSRCLAESRGLEARIVPLESLREVKRKSVADLAGHLGISKNIGNQLVIFTSH